MAWVKRNYWWMVLVMAVIILFQVSYSNMKEDQREEAAEPADIHIEIIHVEGATCYVLDRQRDNQQMECIAQLKEQAR